MSCREATGISHSVSSIRRSSDIEHRPCPDPAFFRAELELVVRDGLHEMRRSAPEALYGGVQTVARQLERGDRLGHEILGFCQDDQFVEPVGQERCPLRRAKRDLMTGGIPARGLVEELGERGESCGEELGLLGALERELELRGVLDPSDTPLCLCRGGIPCQDPRSHPPVSPSTGGRITTGHGGCCAHC